VDTYGTNVMGTSHVLEAARFSPDVRAVVVVTSDKCYENHETLRSYRETDPMGGADPYSSSKGCAELVTSAYRRSFFSGNDSALVATARAGNVIGGGDWAEDRLVPDIVRAVASGESVVVRNPGSIRPWQHVLEPLRGYLMLGAGLLEGDAGLAEGWNFGPGDDGDVSVEELTERMIRVWGKGNIVTHQDGDALPEAGLLKLDISKARALLGYQPLIDLDRLIEWTVGWYRTCLEDPSRARMVTEQQIADYVGLLSSRTEAIDESFRSRSDQLDREPG
jgi:CDP-glucose 4,6-dehydratase